MLQYFLFLGLLSLNLCLLLFKFVDLGVEPLNFVVFDLTELEGLLLIEFFPLLNFLVDEILLPLLGHILPEF